jgi:alkylation response protein AidB-like acyl-CoA dehydrogenase
MTSAQPTVDADLAAAERLIGLGWESPLTIPELEQAETPQERIVTVAKNGFAALAIPEDFGGGGAGLAQVAAAQRALALVDPSAAIALNMHSLSIGVMVDYWDRNRDESWMLLEGIANTHALVASAFAEPGGSSNFMRSRASAVPTADGYVISGTKFPCSLATTAEIFCLSAGVDGVDESIVGLCPAKSPGLSVQGEWGSIGMRGSDTARVVLEGVELDERLVFHRGPPDDLDEVVIAGILWFAVLVTATYHGVLSSLLGHGIETAHKRGSEPGGQRQILLGRAARELFLLGAACRELAGAWEAGTLRGAAALSAAMSIRAGLSDARERTIAALTPVLGARLYTAKDPAAAAAIDSLAVHHHPPNLMACDSAIGAFHLDRPMSFDPAA